jgi:hypothetical protein
LILDPDFEVNVARAGYRTVAVVPSLLLAGGGVGGEPERARDPGIGCSWTYLPRYSSQFDDK